MKRKVIKKITLGPDLELHVSSITSAVLSMVDVRQFVPSAKEYARGVTMPRTVAEEVADALDLA